MVFQGNPLNSWMGLSGSGWEALNEPCEELDLFL